MSTRRRNIAIGWGLGITGVAANTYFVHWTAQHFYLSNTAEIVLAVMGGVSFGLIAGYVYVEREAKRKRAERLQQAREAQASILLQREIWRRQ